MSDISLSILIAAINDNLAAIEQIEWLDHDLGQYNNDRYPFKYPAVFVSLPNIIWEKKFEEKQRGTVRIRLRIVYEFEQMGAFEERGDPGGINEEVDNLYSLFSSINNAMCGVGTSNPQISCVIKINDYLEKTDTEKYLQIYVMEFLGNVLSQNGVIDNSDNVNFDYDDLVQKNMLLQRKEWSK